MTTTQEMNAANSGTILVPLTDLGLIRASGEEAAKFLHNMLTNDVHDLPTAGARLNGLCTPKGRLLASFLMWRDRESADFLLQLSADLIPSILKKLSMYVLRTKVTLTDASGEQVLVGLSGPNSTVALAAIGVLPPAPEAILAATNSEHVKAIRLGEQRFLLAIDASVAPAIWEKLAAHAAPAGLSAWRWLEIQAGMPRIVAATQEAFVPQMINFELIGGVSFKKGCYPGQEVVARTQLLGKTKRRMYRAHVEGKEPVPGDSLYAAETEQQPCGTVVLGAPAPQGGYEALVVVQMDCIEKVVRLGSPEGACLSFQPLPYAIT